MSHSGPAEVFRPDLLAGRTAFLAPDAARNISGALIVSDGGQAVGAGAIQL